MKKDIFRHEDKYILDDMQAAILKARAGAVLRPDSHTRPDGCYTIKSLYFDDINNSCYYDTENGNDPRAKFRIRLYNDDIGMLRLEKKIKQNGLTLKKQTVISREECERLILGKPFDTAGINDEGKKSLITEFYMRGLVPVIIVEYERLPYVYPASDLRFTIDDRISYSTDVKGFPERKARMLGTRPGFHIMELKWNSFLPGYLTECLAIGSLQRSRFSKYYYCRSMTF